MLEALFGNRTIEHVLFYLSLNEVCYATELHKRMGTSLSTFQNALDRLEQGGILVSSLQGKTRIYSFNSRYAFFVELTVLLRRAYEFLPQDIKEEFYEPVGRKRPRKKRKPLKYVEPQP